MTTWVNSYGLEVRDIAYQQRLASELKGARLIRVEYALVRAEEDAAKIRDSDWNYGTWHYANLGVQLYTDRDRAFAVTWAYEPRFCEYDTALTSSLPTHVPTTSPFTPRAVNVTDSAQWAAFLSLPIDVSVDVWPADRVNLVRLTAGDAQATITTASPRRGELPRYPGYVADEVAVHFSQGA
jgi:hypothetical protein